jgi:hypothetical protein
MTDPQPTPPPPSPPFQFQLRTLLLTDPAGPVAGNGHALRGGSWISGWGGCRCADRFRLPPGERRNYEDEAMLPPAKSGRRSGGLANLVSDPHSRSDPSSCATSAHPQRALDVPHIRNEVDSADSNKQNVYRTPRLSSVECNSSEAPLVFH